MRIDVKVDDASPVIFRCPGAVKTYFTGRYEELYRDNKNRFDMAFKRLIMGKSWTFLVGNRTIIKFEVTE